MKRNFSGVENTLPVPVPAIAGVNFLNEVRELTCSVIKRLLGECRICNTFLF